MQQCLVFSLDELYWLFAAACNMRFAHTGTQVWTFSRLPIGGLLSKTGHVLCTWMAGALLAHRPESEANCRF